MHHTVTTLIQRYESLEAGADPAGTLRRTLVETMSTALHPDIIDLFARLLTDPRGSDLAQLEVLKTLEFAVVGDDEQYRRIGQTILSVVRTADDLVRNYAVMAAHNFADVEGMFEAVTEILLDGGEDLDLRWNAFAFIRTGGNSARSRAVLGQLEHDSEFAAATTELLGQWAS